MDVGGRAYQEDWEGERSLGGGDHDDEDDDVSGALELEVEKTVDKTMMKERGALEVETIVDKMMLRVSLHPKNRSKMVFQKHILEVERMKEGNIVEKKMMTIFVSLRLRG